MDRMWKVPHLPTDHCNTVGSYCDMGGGGLSEWNRRHFGALSWLTRPLPESPTVSDFIKRRRIMKLLQLSLWPFSV